MTRLETPIQTQRNSASGDKGSVINSSSQGIQSTRATKNTWGRKHLSPPSSCTRLGSFDRVNSVLQSAVIWFKLRLICAVRRGQLMVRGSGCRPRAHPVFSPSGGKMKVNEYASSFSSPHPLMPFLPQFVQFVPSLPCLWDFVRKSMIDWLFTLVILTSSLEFDCLILFIGR
ncbi:hypothetical protein E2C01_073662 [Portunus trituberculatus]|uniref:Uncharacterized protein n=1 Tax=Portunus trituberculatus TaxID=210409 RepID=A0A5B7IB54_PORTR|nr:hypothetical protein [Portunus trituberculatus]